MSTYIGISTITGSGADVALLPTLVGNLTRFQLCQISLIKLYAISEKLILRLRNVGWLYARNPAFEIR